MALRTPTPIPAGFTLLETLVALVITALASVLIIQGVSHTLMLRERVIEHTQYQREDALRRAWFQDTVSTLIADLQRIESHRFQGGPGGFAGLTLAPLQEQAGVPTAVQWYLEREDDIVHLFYRQAGAEPQRVWSWRSERAGFRFYDPETGWTDQWPPAPRGADALPAAVMFETTWRGSPRVWVAAVQGRRNVRSGLVPPPEFQ